MSREMKAFTDYFFKGLDRGMGWADKAEAKAIARERNKIMQERNAAVDKRENIKLGYYGEQVKANAERARAAAYKSLHPTAKGGGGGSGSTTDPDVVALQRRAAEQGILSAPVKSDDGGGTTINNTYEAQEAPDPPDAPAPVEGGYGDSGAEVQTEARGGMIRKMAGGGAVAKYDDGGMTLAQAQSYSAGYTPRADPRSTTASNYSSSYNAAAKYAADKAKKPADTIKNAAPTPTGPLGTGPAGSYTTQDVRPGGVLDTTSAGISGQDYRRGGAVRRFADGGPVRFASNEEKLIKPEATPGMADIPVGRGRLSLGANYDPNSRYGTAEAGYEHPVGRDTTIGVRGDIGKDLGPEGASAKPNWGVGVRGRIKFAEGGSVMQDKDDPMNAAGPKLSPFVQKYIDDYNSGVAKQGEMPNAGAARSGPAGGGMNWSTMGGAGGSADGATGSGGDSTGGVSGTGGVGGSASAGEGGSAAAGTSGGAADAGDGGGTYRRGGRVRRFQSGGRVMEAIDTGTSGPGSGYGYRAAPPARRY